MFTKDQRIEDLIIECLVSGPQETASLLEAINAKRTGTTKQAVYKALRQLRADEVIIQTRGEVALSSLWLKKLATFTEQARLNYSMNDQPSLDFLALKNGEKIVYWFKSFEATDIFWGHAFDILLDNTPKSAPVFIYNPHEWFLLARPETETFLFNRFKAIGRKLFLIAGNRDALDIESSKYFDNETTNYHPSPEPLFEKNNYNVNIFNDYLIEVWLDPKISNLIDQFYKKHSTLTDDAKNELLTIIKQRGRNKLVIYRNERKARKLGNMFKKVFIF